MTGKSFDLDEIVIVFVLLALHHDSWKDGKEDAALTRSAAYANTAALGLDDAFGQSQTKTCSLILPGGIGVELLEINKESLDILRQDADAGVLYLQDEGLLVLGPDSDSDPPLFRRVFDGIGEIVVEYLLELRRVESQFAQGRIDLHFHVDALMGSQRTQAVTAFPCELLQIDHLWGEGHLARLYLGQVEQLVDEREQVPATGKDIPKILFLLLREGADHFVMQQLRETDDAVERGA